MNEHSSYSSAPPSEASASAQNYQCQSTLDNVTRWLQQHEAERDASFSRVNLFEAELTKQLAKLRATGGTNTPSSLSRNVSEQSVAPPAVVHLTRQPYPMRPEDKNAQQRVVSSAPSSNKRGWDAFMTGQSKQPRISDPTLVTDIPFQPSSQTDNSNYSNQTTNGNNKNNNNVNDGFLTPPSSAANSTDNASQPPPPPPREPATSSSSALVLPQTTASAVPSEKAPPLPPRPPYLQKAGVDIHLSSPNVAISVEVPQGARMQQFNIQPSNNPNSNNRLFFDGRTSYPAVPPAPPGSTSSQYSDARFRVMPSPGTYQQYQHTSYPISQHPAFSQRLVFGNGSPMPGGFVPPPASSTNTCQSTAFSNMNYSIWPEYSNNGNDSLADRSISLNGSTYAFYDQVPNSEMGRIRITDANNISTSRPQQQSSTKHFFIQSPPEQHTTPPVQRRVQQISKSPLPERRQRNSARIEDGTIVGLAGREAYSNSRNYSSEAYKFFMEQHIENLIKCSAQRKERRHQFDSFMTSQNLNTEAECRPFRQHLAKSESNYLRVRRARLEPSFFEPLKTLGIGAFGEVALVRKRDTRKLYAMKTLRKVDVIKRNQVAHVKAERDILAEANSDWVVKLFFSFQDRENLYFIMDYIPGGDLMNLLIKKGVFPEPMARFYTAELVSALEYVHSMGFIHRDIKPDNVLIDQEGHVKLTDFGLCTGFRWTHQSNRYAKIRPEEPIWIYASTPRLETAESSSTSSLTLPHRHRRVHSLVGTPNYIAPEVVLKSGYNHSCDWWSVGVILYEMLVGRPPFLSETPAETQYKIIHWKNYLGFPPGIGLSQAAADLILQLIRDADSRLGAFGGAADIKAHAFFGNIDFENLRKQPAVFVPLLKNEMDTSHFDPSNQTEQPDFLDQNTPPVPAVGPAAFSFYEFTFRRFCDDAGCPLPPLQPISTDEEPPLNSASATTTTTTNLLSGDGSSNTTVTATVVTDAAAAAAKPPLPPPLPPRPKMKLSSSVQPDQPSAQQQSSASKPLPPDKMSLSTVTNPTFV